jgi:hypothetical protein
MPYGIDPEKDSYTDKAKILKESNNPFWWFMYAEALPIRIAIYFAMVLIMTTMFGKFGILVAVCVIMWSESQYVERKK